MIDDKISRFQVTKSLKMYTINTRQISKELMIPLKFGFGSFVRFHVCSIHHVEMRHCRLNASHHDNKLPNTEMFTIMFG